MSGWNLSALEQPILSLYGFSQVGWEAELGGLSSHNMSFEADGKKYVLKLYGASAQAQLARLEGLAFCLNQQGFSAPVPVPNRFGDLHSVVDGKCIAVFLRAPGRILHQDTI